MFMGGKLSYSSVVLKSVIVRGDLKCLLVLVVWMGVMVVLMWGILILNFCF